MKNKLAWVSVTFVVFALASAVRADDAPPSTAAQIRKMDKGPDSIDVSNYPPEQQENYKVFASKCSQCHTLARAINSPYVSREEWSAYVAKMSQKKGSGLRGDSARVEKLRRDIISFLAYDSSVRKKDIAGPRTIDVSNYPPEQQANYLVFAAKCSKCHSLARPINAQYALPEEWTAYVDKMAKKKGSGLMGDSAEMKKTREQILSFLIYDSSVRKKALIERKTAAKAAGGGGGAASGAR